MKNMKKWLVEGPAKRLCILRGKEQIRALYIEMMGKTPASNTSKEKMVSAILGAQLEVPASNASADFKWLLKSDCPCACKPCLSPGTSNACLSPFKKQMNSTYIRIKHVISKPAKNTDVTTPNDESALWDHYDRVHGGLHPNNRGLVRTVSRQTSDDES